MKIYLLFFLFFTFSSQAQEQKQIVQCNDYKLVKVENAKGLLVLFPCFPCDAENTFSEFKIEEVCIKNKISILAMNFNYHLFLSSDEKQNLAEKLTKIVLDNQLNNNNLYIGWFSSGGNVSFLLADYLCKNSKYIQPKGVFLVDSPIDLYALYITSLKNLKLNISENTIQEATWLKDYFEKEFGNPETNFKNYEKNSPFTSKTDNIDNIKGLSKLKIRLYTEPDLKWWYQRNKNEYHDLNAYFIEKLALKLKKEFGDKNIELIQTKDKGFRENGEKHPHSWTIVDVDDLVFWMLN